MSFLFQNFIHLEASVTTRKCCPSAIQTRRKSSKPSVESGEQAEVQQVDPPEAEHVSLPPPIPAPTQAEPTETPSHSDGIQAVEVESKKARKAAYQWEFGGIAAHRARVLCIFRRAKDAKVFQTRDVRAVTVMHPEDPTATVRVKSKSEKWSYITECLNVACTRANFGDPHPAMQSTVSRKVQTVVEMYEEWQRSAPKQGVFASGEDQSSTGNLTATAAIAKANSTPDLLNDDTLVCAIEAYVEEATEYRGGLKVSRFVSTNHYLSHFLRRKLRRNKWLTQKQWQLQNKRWQHRPRRRLLTPTSRSKSSLTYFWFVPVIDAATIERIAVKMVTYHVPTSPFLNCVAIIIRTC